jgi:hypothetical protein
VHRNQAGEIVGPDGEIARPAREIAEPVVAAGVDPGDPAGPVAAD